MNLTDLFLVAVFVSGLYGLIVALSGRKHFLLSGVNPHRMQWLLAAVSAISFGRGLLWWESLTTQMSTLELIKLLITDQPTPVRVKMASAAITLGLVFIGLVSYCWVMLPRDPSTYYRPQDRRKAMQYYVMIKGGLDYAILAGDEGIPLFEACEEKQVEKRIEFLPRYKDTDGNIPPHRTAAEQIQFWRDAALSIHRHMEQLDMIVTPAHQGHNRRILFDVQYGGFYFVYLRLPDAKDGGANCLYLFGATLNQAEINHKNADEHFDMLTEAMKNVYRNIGMDI